MTKYRLELKAEEEDDTETGRPAIQFNDLGGKRFAFQVSNVTAIWESDDQDGPRVTIVLNGGIYFYTRDITFTELRRLIGW